MPTAEDVVVQKLRWAREKDLVDVEDLLAIQGVGNLDLGYVRRWCWEHGSEGRLDVVLTKVPEV